LHFGEAIGEDINSTITGARNPVQPSVNWRRDPICRTQWLRNRDRRNSRRRRAASATDKKIGAAAPIS
jgi:hypothetical protein